MVRPAYDLLIVGSGMVADSATYEAYNRVRRVAVAQPIDTLGSRDLYPVESMLYLTNLLQQSKRVPGLGWQWPLTRLDWQAVQEHFRQTLPKLRRRPITQARLAQSGQGKIDRLVGKVHFVSPHEVAVDGQVLEAEQIVITLAPETAVPDVPGLKEAGFLVPQSALSLTQLPDTLAILGDGPSGLELAQMFSRFGVRVALLSRRERLLPHDEAELVDKLVQRLRAENVRLETAVSVRDVSVSDRGKLVSLANESVAVDEILLVERRWPDLAPLNLAAAGIRNDGRYIAVDDTLRTNVSHVWAAGQAANSPYFNHIAATQAQLAVRNALNHHTPQPFNRRTLSWVSYTDPELARIGRTTAELHQDGTRHQSIRLSARRLARRLGKPGIEGTVKFLVGAEEQILGAHVFGQRAGELLLPIALAIHANLPVTKFMEGSV